MAPERDEIDDFFDKLVDHQSNECDIDDIDPSKPGWEIFIHFGDVDPRVPGTQAHEDFKTFKYLEKFCLARCEYKEGTRTLMLFPLDGCCEDQFSPEHVQLMQRYSPRAKAPVENQRPPAKTLAPPPPSAPVTQTSASIKTATRDSASEILAGVGRAMISRPPQIITVEEKKFEVPDDLLITLPLEGAELSEILEATKCADLEELIGKLQSIAEEEELHFEHGEAEGIYIINIYKDASVKYFKPMDPTNMAFIMKLPFEKVGLVPPQD